MKGRWLAGLLLAMAAALLGWWLWLQPAPRQTLQVADLMASADNPRFARVIAPRPFDFPADHHAHRAYRTEWWYLTGNLQRQDDPQLLAGFQFTLFRFALQPDEAKRRGWLSPQLYLAHLGISDLAAGRHLSVERHTREGPGLAGASGMRFWLYDWQLKASSPDQLFPASLIAQQQQLGLELTLVPLKPKVLQGDRGFSRKSAGTGNASYYYSYPRLAVTGRLKHDGQWHAVTGEAWFDHEWSTSALAEHQLGWDWFSIQLSDGRELMLYRFRNRPDYDGPSFNAATLIEVNGHSRALDGDAIGYHPGEIWISPRTGNRYPTRWRVTIPELAMDLEIRARLDAQEMAHSVTYWEGSIEVSGSHQGQGYLEMAGY